jgi:hypothetical protein
MVRLILLADVDDGSCGGIVNEIRCPTDADDISPA